MSSAQINTTELADKVNSSKQSEVQRPTSLDNIQHFTNPAFIPEEVTETNNDMVQWTVGKSPSEVDSEPHLSPSQSIISKSCLSDGSHTNLHHGLRTTFVLDEDKLPPRTNASEWIPPKNSDSSLIKRISHKFLNRKSLSQPQFPCVTTVSEHVDTTPYAAASDGSHAMTDGMLYQQKPSKSCLITRSNRSSLRAGIHPSFIMADDRMSEDLENTEVSDESGIMKKDSSPILRHPNNRFHERKFSSLSNGSNDSDNVTPRRTRSLMSSLPSRSGLYLETRNGHSINGNYAIKEEEEESGNAQPDVNQIAHSLADITQMIVSQRMTNPLPKRYLLSKREMVEEKCFAKDVRAQMDIEKFMENAIILLNWDVGSLEDVVKTMVLKSLVQMKVPGYEALIEPPDIDETVLRSSGSELQNYHVIHESPDIEHLYEDAVKSTMLIYKQKSLTYRVLAKTLQSVAMPQEQNEVFEVDPSWVCAMCPLQCINKSQVSIARFKHPVNLGKTCETVRFFILVVSPQREKHTKSDVELAKTFCTIFSNEDFRKRLLNVPTPCQFKKYIQEEAKKLHLKQILHRKDTTQAFKSLLEEEFSMECKWPILNGIREDLKRRVPYYLSDFIDIFRDRKSIKNLVITVTFLYFIILLPSIALGNYNDHNTDGKIGVRQNVLSQAISGLIFSIFGGQPLIILLSSAPISIYIEVIQDICTRYDMDLLAFYGCVGIFCAALLILYSITDLSRFMRWATRSTEDIFALFIAVAFCVDAGKESVRDFKKYYCDDTGDSNDTIGNSTDSYHSLQQCDRSSSVLYILLLFGLVWIGLVLMNFTTTPFLNQSKRKLLADFSLPISVIFTSFLGSYLFRHIKMTPFEVKPWAVFKMEYAKLTLLPWSGVLASFLLALPLSVLIFMEQSLAGIVASAPSNRLKKGPAYHWDMLIIGLINGGLSIVGLPWIHGTIPHTPMHVRALADVQEHVSAYQVVQHVVRSRETRVTNLLAHILIALSLLMLPIPLQYIPIPVLNGLFIFLAITSLYENQFVRRILLLITEQRAYPPSHYIRRVPQRCIHLFTFAQLIQLGALCAVAFAPFPYVQIIYPLLMIVQLPIRHILIPKFIKKSYLDSMDACF